MLAVDAFMSFETVVRWEVNLVTIVVVLLCTVAILASVATTRSNSRGLAHEIVTAINLVASELDSLTRATAHGQHRDAKSDDDPPTAG